VLDPSDAGLLRGRTGVNVTALAKFLNMPAQVGKVCIVGKFFTKEHAEIFGASLG
jgi:hypothetical protein